MTNDVAPAQVRFHGLCQGLSRTGVVSRIGHDHGRGMQHLQTARALNLGESPGHGIRVQGLASHLRFNRAPG